MLVVAREIQMYFLGYAVRCVERPIYRSFKNFNALQSMYNLIQHTFFWSDLSALAILAGGAVRLVESKIVILLAIENQSKIFVTFISISVMQTIVWTGNSTWPDVGSYVKRPCFSVDIFFTVLNVHQWWFWRAALKSKMVIWAKQGKKHRFILKMNFLNWR